MHRTYSIPVFRPYVVWPAILLCVACGPNMRSLAVDAIDVGSQLELFADDALIDEIQGDAALKLHRPVPQEVVLTTDEPWEGNTSAYYTIFRSQGLFRMYYRGSHYDEVAKKATHEEVTCYAESKDGIHWEKPNLGLFEFEGSKKNNIVWNGIGTHCFTVFFDQNPQCPADSRYKAIARGRPRGKKGLYVFSSPDGLNWKLLRDEPVITDGAFDSQNLAFWDAESKVYREYHRTFIDGVRSIMTGTSTNFLDWSEPVLLDYGDAPREHLYTNAVLPYPRAPHILLGFPTRYLPNEGQRVEPTLMASHDGLHFKRWLEPLIPEDAPEDRSGNRSNYMAWGLLDLPGKADEYSVYATEAYYQGPDSRVRRFSIRKDGFVSLHGGRASGRLITKPLKFTGSNLYLNYQCSSAGSVRVEIRSEDVQPLSGFDLNSCQPLEGDAIAGVVRWDAAELNSLHGKPVTIAIEARDADVFSFQFK